MGSPIDMHAYIKCELVVACS